MGWREEFREVLKERAAANTFKFAEGDNTIRVLPNKKGVEHRPAVIFRVHKEVGPNRRFLKCGKTREGKGPCWLCDVKIPALAQSDKPGLNAKAKTLEANEQVVMQVAWKDQDSGVWKGPKPLFLTLGKGRAFGNRLLSFLIQKPYDDPVKGRNIVITRTGTTKNTTVYDSITAEDAPERVPPVLLTKLKSFEEIVGAYSKEAQIAAYEGREPAEEEEPEQEEVPTEEVEASEEPEAGEEAVEDVGEGEERVVEVVEEEVEEKPQPRRKPRKAPVEEEPIEYGEETTGESEEGEPAEDSEETASEEGEAEAEEGMSAEEEELLEEPAPIVRKPAAVKPKPKPRAVVEEEPEEQSVRRPVAAKKTRR